MAKTNIVAIPKLLPHSLSTSTNVSLKSSKSCVISNGFTDTHCDLALHTPVDQKVVGSCQWCVGVSVVPIATEWRSVAAEGVRT